MMRWAAFVGLCGVFGMVAYSQTVATKDGLQLSFAPDGTLQMVQLARKQFRGVGGFFFAEPTDAPENLRWAPLKGKGKRKGDRVTWQLSGAGLELTATFMERPDAIFGEGVVRDTTGKDRAIVLAFALPLDATNWQWWDNLRSTRQINGKVATHYTATIRYGTRGEHSPYPFCAVNSEETGIALGIPLDLPVIHRFVYDAAQKVLRLEWDFGLSPDGGTRIKGNGTGERQVSTAIFRFSVYTLDEPRWGMRAAADKFYRLFPESFRVRVKRFGIWMPFTDIAKIADFEDFGFAYHEGAQNPDFNRRHGFYNFPYVEPWSAWFFLPPDAPTDLTVEQLFAYPNKREQHPNLAEIVKTCGVQDEQGRYSLRVWKTDPVHWAGGQTLYNFLVNADPDIAKGEGQRAAGEATKAKAMDETLRTVLADERLDGVYFDGFGEWVMPNENYRRDHWRVADFPLTFSWRTKRPTQLAAFGIYEYLASAAEQLHAAGKLVMANGFGYGFPFHAHWVDVGGNEIQWTRQRDDFAFFDYRRVLASRKPYLPLNNEFFDREFTADVAEDYFRWALFYGFPPSCFAPGAGAFGNYWDTPEFHNRDRHLFRRYVPLIVRLCESGWEPITQAWTDNEGVLVERFGRWSDGNLHFTLHNATDRMQNVRLFVDAAKLGMRERDLQNLTVWVLTDMKPFPFAVGETKWSRLTVLLAGTLAPRETALLWFAPTQTVSDGLAALAKAHLQRAISKGRRRLKAPPNWHDATKQAAETQPKFLAEWVQWLRRIGELEAQWREQTDSINVAADFTEAHRIVGALVRELLALQTDAVMPENLAAGEKVRIPVDVRNGGKETLREVRLTASLSFLPAASPELLTPSPIATELPIGDLPPKALRRELLTLTIPPEVAYRRATLRVALHATVMGMPVILPVDETSVSILLPLEIAVSQFGGEPSILVRVRNNSGDSRKIRITVTSPLEFAEREIVARARSVTEVKLTAIRPPLEMQLSSAQVQVEWSGGQEKVGRALAPTEKGTRDAKQETGSKVVNKIVKWLSLIAIPKESNLLRNGSFEEGNEPPLPYWRFYGVGYRVSSEAVDGKRSLFMESADTQTMRGALQIVTFSPPPAGAQAPLPCPLILHGFSKGEEVSPSGLGGDYSLYLDARYVDGTPLWGEIVPFGGAGWQWGWRLIVPEKPLREVFVYALFRYRRGRAWFDAVGLTELRLPPSLTVTAQSSVPNVKPLLDNDFRTVWHGRGEMTVMVEWKSPVTVRQVVLWWAERAKAERVQVEIWDGKEWRLIAERPTDSDTFVTVVDFPPQTVQRLRVRLAGTQYAVRELQVR